MQRFVQKQIIAFWIKADSVLGSIVTNDRQQQNMVKNICIYIDIYIFFYSFGAGHTFNYIEACIQINVRLIQISLVFHQR